MYISGKIELKAYTDSEQTEFPKELIPWIQKDFSSTSGVSAEMLTFSLIASAVQNINLNGQTPTKVYIYSDTTSLSVSFNGQTGITYGAGTPGFMPLTLTSLGITNASNSASTTVTVVLING